METIEEKIDLYSWLMDGVNLLFSKLYELGNSEDVEPKYYVRRAVPNSDSYSTMSLRIVREETIYNLRRLLEVMAGMIAEFAMLKIDKKTETKLLKNTTWPEVYTLDSLNRRLPQYIHIKCLSVSDKKLICNFKSHLDVRAVLNVLKNSNSNIGELKVEKRKELKIDYYYLTLENKDVLVVSNYSIGFLYQTDSSLWEEYLQMFTEIIIRVHQELLFQEGIRSVFMSIYNPFYRLIKPEMFDDQLSALFKNIRQLSFTGKIQKDRNFSETRKSALYYKDNKLYRYKDEISHLNYIVVCPDKQEIYIDFKSLLDLNVINNYLKTINLSIIIRKEYVRYKKVFKKGAGQRKIEGNNCFIIQDIMDENNRKVASISGRSVIILYLNDSVIFEEGLKLLVYIYYNWLYYTSWIPTAEISHSDLTSVDRTVITNLDVLFNLYSTFLAVIFGREFFNSDDEETHLSEKEWLINFLKQDPASRYEEKMLHLLEFIKEKIDLPEFLSHVTGNSHVDIEARKRLIDLYDKLIRQLSLTQGFINSPNNFN